MHSNFLQVDKNCCKFDNIYYKSYMDLLNKIEEKYKEHDQFNEYLKDDLESAKYD